MTIFFSLSLSSAGKVVSDYGGLASEPESVQKVGIRKMKNTLGDS